LLFASFPLPGSHRDRAPSSANYTPLHYRFGPSFSRCTSLSIGPSGKGLPG
jgi:hypothetical protein